MRPAFAHVSARGGEACPLRSTRAAKSRSGLHTRTAIAGLLALVLTIGGCGDVAESTSARTITDSAGIRIVDNHTPAWASAEAWMVADQPTLTIGAVDSTTAPPLYVAYAAILRDSAVVIANNGSSELLVFDRQGTFIRAIGGRGEGPGEFSGLRGVRGCAGDTLVVVELRRLTVLSPSLDFVRTVTLAPDLIPTPGTVIGVSGDCSAAIVQRSEAADPGVSGVYSAPATVDRVPLDGRSSETLARVPGVDLVNIPVGGRAVPQRLPWGRSPVYAVGGDALYVGASDTAEVRVYGRDGLERIVRWPAPRKPVTDRDRQLFDEELAEEIREEGSRLAQLLPRLDGYPHVPDRKPVYARVLVDDEGFLWVRENQDMIGYLRSAWDIDRDGEPEDWWIFDPDGRWLGSVTIPARLRVLGVQDGFLIAIAFDEYGVERLQLHRLIRNDAGSDAQ